MTSLEKALIILERVLHDEGRTKLTDLAADLDLPRSTLYRLAGSLQHYGLITRAARGRYGIGLRLAARLERKPLTRLLAPLSRPLLQHLADQCASTAHLGVLEDGMVTYVVKVTGQGVAPNSVFTRENAQLEAYCSAIGKVLLAWLPRAEQARYFAAGPFVPLTPRTITESGALRDCLDNVRAAGFARDDGEVAEDLCCFAVPVPWASGRVDVAISISVAPASCTAEAVTHYLEQLRHCASELSARLD